MEEERKTHVFPSFQVNYRPRKVCHCVELPQLEREQFCEALRRDCAFSQKDSKDRKQLGLLKICISALSGTGGPRQAL